MSGPIVIGLGSNQGDRHSHLLRSLKFFSQPGSPLRVLRVSPVYESEAMLPEGAPTTWSVDFLNLAALCELKAGADSSPQAVLQFLKEAELMLGRLQAQRWAPRVIDLDLLAFGSQVLDQKGEKNETVLKIPHPGLLDRPFALLPLADVAPDWLFPSEGPDFLKKASDLALKWRLPAAVSVPFGTRPSSLLLTELVGVLNLTPDSFSDGGRFNDPAKALLQAQQLIEQGARILDIGAESTRPGAVPVDSATEWLRLLPVLEGLKTRMPGVKLSIDTRHSEVARKAVALGADWINDVGGFEDPLMIEAVMDSETDLVVMHSLGIPPSHERVLPIHLDPIEALLHWGETRIRILEASGIKRERVIMDPGIGFGKTPEQAWKILRQIDRLDSLGVRVLVGHSRKSFLSQLHPGTAPERDFETALLSTELARKRVRYLRVHNIDLNQRALKLAFKLDGAFQWQL